MRLAILILFATCAFGQQPQRLFGYWSAGTGWRYGDITLDSTLVLEVDGRGNATLRAIVPPPPPSKTFLAGPGIALVETSATTTVIALKNRETKVLAYENGLSGWTLPTGATRVQVYVQGLRFVPGVDYVIEGGVLRAVSGRIQPDHVVLIDYEQ